LLWSPTSSLNSFFIPSIPMDEYLQAKSSASEIWALSTVAPYARVPPSGDSQEGTCLVSWPSPPRIWNRSPFPTAGFSQFL
ncbi:hypothetical protein PMAYCL1PPCAC_21270, partial [Pristionchus mayeri]